MKKNPICGLILILIVASNALAQQPNFPHPDKTKNIPFGTNPTVALQYDEREKKMFQTLYPGAEKSRYFGNIIAQNKKSSPLFNNSSSLKWQHLVNRDKQISSANKPPQGVGANFHLTADINPLAESDPGNIGLYISPLDWVYPVVNNVSYSEGDDGIHGRELLRSNGTAAGTYLVKDINPGPASTLIRNMIAINGKVYFSASTDGYSYHPWVTNGTEAGTQILDGINGIWSYSPQQFISVNNAVYFITDGNTYRSSIWQTDGTAAGTLFIYDVSFFGYADDIQQATASNGLLFFTVYTAGLGRQVWRCDGTFAGTFIVTAFTNTYDYNFDVPMQLTDYNSKLYFSANDGTGRKLWISDGTLAGTTYAPGNHDILMQTDYLQWDHTQPFPILNNVLYLSGYTYDSGNGLYKYDAATNDGLVLVKDLTPGLDPMFIVPGESRVINNTLYMKVISSIDGWHDELWSTNGNAAGTSLVKSFAGEPGAYMISLKNGYGTLYFVKGDAVYGSEVWKSDGTTVGTVIVKDVNAGPRNSQPWYFTECNGKVLFSLHEANTGAELWSTDGSPANTKLVKDINTTSTSPSDAGIFYKGVIATNSGVLFGAFAPGTGAELYKSDGTVNGTLMLNEISPGEGWSYPNSFISRNGSYYFIADNATGTAIYKTDGITKNSLKKVTVDINRDNYSVVNFDVADNGKVFYSLYNKYTFGYELWTSNGTPSGTINLSTNVYYIPVLVTSGNNAFFSAGDFTYGFELWKSDGTIAGTIMVKDINAGPDGSYPYSLISNNGSVYFGANDNTYTYSLWKSDGTEAGTFVLANVQFPWTSNSEELKRYATISDNSLYFAGASNATFQSSLWKSNGTVSGTNQVSAEQIFPFNLTDVDGTLFFNAYDIFFNVGIWKFISKKTNPELVKPGITTQFPASACGKFYFVVGDALWSSDGTDAGTNPVNDPFIGGLYSPANLTGSNNKIFFSAYSYQTGRELFVGNACASSNDAPVASRPAPIVSRLEEKQANLNIYPNPAREVVNVIFFRENIAPVRITVTDITGRIVLDKKVTGRNGNNTVPLSIKSLPKGSYFIKVSGNEKEVKQFVKLN